MVLSEGLDQAPLDSSTYRLHLWRFGITKWLERPLVGWGLGMTDPLVQAENAEELKNFGRESFDHLHNAYLELLLQLGVIGYVLVLWQAVLMTVSLIKAARERGLSIHLFSFYMGNFVLNAVYSLTDFRHLHWNWRYYWLILAGVVLAHCLAMAQARRNRQEQH